MAYRSAQHAVDVWCRANAALTSIGAIDYADDDTRHSGSGEPQYADPSGLMQVRAQLKQVFEEAKTRAPTGPWCIWWAHRVLGEPLALLPVEPDGEASAETVARTHIRRIDDVVETVLDERGLLSGSYQDRADDHEALTAV